MTKSNQVRIQPGAQVVGSDNQYAGVVAQLRPQQQDMLVVDRRTGGDIYIPFSAIQGLRGDTVVLNLPAADVDLRNWAHPATAGTVGGSPARPGPAGTGMPFGEPGWPTFEGTGRDNPGPGSSNLVSDKKADFPNTPTAGSLSRNPAPRPIDLEEEINENWITGAEEEPPERREP